MLCLRAHTFLYIIYKLINFLDFFCFNMLLFITIHFLIYFISQNTVISLLQFILYAI